jgi:PPOX class probable FMN-dependent enzyme
VTDLRQLYRQPHRLVLDKAMDHVDPAAATFLAASPLVVVATSGPGGADASPRGGPPGFVRVLDGGGRRIAFADLAGNNRIDTYSNISVSPEVGLLCFVPGVDETLRINGAAEVTTDASVLDATAIDGRRPKVAVVVEVHECYIHCGKALRRAGMWDPARWIAAEDRPSAAAILTEQLDLDVDPAVVAADLEAGYQATLWEPGAR